MSMTTTRRKLARKEADFKRFDALPLEERKRLTDQGLNPHESEAVRKKKQDRVKGQIEKDISRYPKNIRERLLSRMKLGKYTNTRGLEQETRPGKSN